jgi:uncharacterized protein YqfA (UPF0365 family)
MAVAMEQEQQAFVQESRAKLVEAQAEVPKAMSESFQSGKLAVMQYYQLRNVQADTDMRKAISGADRPESRE